jgi:hypothetical protein
MAGAWRNALRNWLDGNRSSTIRKTQDPPLKTTHRKLTARGWGTPKSEKQIPRAVRPNARKGGVRRGPRSALRMRAFSVSGGREERFVDFASRRKSRGHDFRAKGSGRCAQNDN